MEFLNSIFSWLIKKRIHDIELFKKYPVEVQDELFSDLVLAASNTIYGRRYGVQPEWGLNQFRDKVPVVRYEDLWDDIMQIKHWQAGDTLARGY